MIVSLSIVSLFLGGKFTPWFKLVVENFIYKWWDALIEGKTSSFVYSEHHLNRFKGTLDNHIDAETIHKPEPKQ